MTDAYYQTIANTEYENIMDIAPSSTMDDEFKNFTIVLIAEHTGAIPKNFQDEHDRLTAYSYYPPMTVPQIRTLTIENVTSGEVKRNIAEQVYKQLGVAFEQKMVGWNSIVQTMAKRFVTNAVDESVDAMRDKLSESFVDENQTGCLIVQRFVLQNNLLKLV